MRIQRLELRAYGPFTERVFDFSEPVPGLHVIYGLNEAGKTSLLRAVREWLFGMPHQTNADFLHPARQLRISGTLINDQGQELTFTRRKARTDSILSAADDPLPDAALSPFLAGVDQATFMQRFGIDRQELVAGGLAIGNNAELSEILFSAGAGISNVQAILAELDQTARSLYLPSGSKPKINVLQKQLQELRQKQKQLILTSSKWSELDSAVKAAVEKADEQRARLLEKRRELDQWRRLQQARTLVIKRGTLQERLDPLKGRPMLPVDFVERRSRAQTQWLQVEQQERQAARQVKRLLENIENLKFSAGLLNERAVIVQLHQRLGTVNKSAIDRPRVLGEARQYADQAARLESELRRSFVGSDTTGWLLPEETRVALRRAAEARLRWEERWQAAQEQVRDLERQLESLKNNRPEPVESLDLTQAKRTLGRLARQSGLEEQIEHKSRERQRLEQQWRQALAALPIRPEHWKDDDYDSIGELPLPLAETLEQAESEFAAVKQTIDQNRQRALELDTRIQTLTADVEALQLVQQVPTEHDLIVARQTRDAQWEKLQKLSATSPEPSGLINADHSPLAVTFWEQVLACDAIVDRLRREADRVAQLAQWMAERQALQARREQTERDLSQAQLALDQWQQRWLELWRPCGLHPLSCKEMMAWRRHFLEILEDWRNWQGQTLELNGLRESLANSVADLEELTELLSRAAGDRTIRFEGDLAQRIEGAQDVLQNWELRISEQMRFETRLQDLRQQVTAKQAEQAETKAKGDQIQTQWVDALSKNGLHTDVEPSTLETIIKRYDDWRQQRQLEKERNQRVAGMERDESVYRLDVERLVMELGGQSLADRNPVNVVEELYEQLERSQQAATKLEEWTGQLKEAEEQLQTLRDQKEHWKQELQALCQIADIQDENQFAQAEVESESKRKITEDLAACEDALIELSGRGDLNQFAQEVEAAWTDAEEADKRIRDLSDAVQALEVEERHWAEQVGGLRNELERMDGSGAAALVQEDIEGVLAQIRTEAGRYGRWRLAAELLNLAMERYRDSNQGGVLGRASELFAELTQGSFTGLRAEPIAKGGFQLVGVRPNESLGVDPAGMSEGTCDQMYLAVRLALLEAYLDSQESMPLLVDDLLITFDDPRSAVALQVLQRLAEKTQVIFLTHHWRQVELAQRHLAADRLAVHELTR